jgi:hypothetical protein
MAIVADEIQLGKGNVGIKTYSEGAYDSGYTDCGATTEKGVTFNYKADELKKKCGNHGGVVKYFYIGEEASLDIELEQITAAILAKACGLADTDIEDDLVNHIKSFMIGGNNTTNYFSVQHVVDFDNGLWARLTCFKCQFTRDLKLPMAAKDTIDVPWKLNIVNDDAEGDTNGKLAMVEFNYEAE